MWTYEQVQSLLSEAGTMPDGESTVADVICYHFDIQPHGNVDPSQVIRFFSIFPRRLASLETQTPTNQAEMTVLQQTLTQQNYKMT